MKFFNIDLHISIIADIKKIFNDLGHDVDDKSLSDHTWVFQRQKDSIPMLDHGRWQSLSPTQLSQEFYDNYSHIKDEYDGFIVTYPPTFSLLYKYFDKPVIINNPIRYEWPFSFNAKYWNEFNEYLRTGFDNNKIILVANNIYDQKYMELFIERPVKCIPSICDYYNDGHYTGCTDKVLYYSRDYIPEISNDKIVYKNHIFKTHTHYNLRTFKGIIHIPYQISYMSIFEQYTYNIPIIIPTKDFLIQMYKEKKYNVLKEVSWNNLYNQKSNSYIKCNFDFDPNDYNSLESLSYWLNYADFYDENWMPYITYFSSFKDLNEIVNDLDYDEISSNMKIFNMKRQEQIHNMWKETLEVIR